MMRVAYSVRFDSERWSTGSWFGMHSRYRTRQVPPTVGSLRLLWRLAPRFYLQEVVARWVRSWF